MPASRCTLHSRKVPVRGACVSQEAPTLGCCHCQKCHLLDKESILFYLGQHPSMSDLKSLTLGGRGAGGGGGRRRRREGGKTKMMRKKKMRDEDDEKW